jgi:hypothetical protein
MVVFVSKTQPLLQLLNPRAQLQPMLWILGLSVPLGIALVYAFQVPMWMPTVLTLALLVVPAWRKVVQDARLYGHGLAVLSALLLLQAVHSLEHVAQMVQFYGLGWPAKDSTGLLMAGNVEALHFAWSWAVAFTVMWLMWRGRLRNGWGWLLLIWAIAHGAEHAYLLWQYLEKLGSLWSNGMSLQFAEGQPGFFGRNGWLFHQQFENPTIAFVCQLAPGLITSARIDVHWWWNTVTTVLLLSYSHHALGQVWGQPHAQVRPERVVAAKG